MSDMNGGTDPRARATEFWFQFDNAFNPGFGQVSDEVFEAYAATDSPDGPLQRWNHHRRNGTYPDGFRQDMERARDSHLRLAELQLQIIDQHFAGDSDAERGAFEDFGQGVLFNDRRPPTDKVHKMDIGGPDDPPIGYHRWHACIRAAVTVGADPDRWLTIDRLVGLAWAIQSEARPEQDSATNPGLSAERLAALREHWTSLDFDALDTEFDSDPFPRSAQGRQAPQGAARAVSGYDRQ
ncbi:MAG: hypothetical protein ACR2HV_09000 [Acidimicrobiales bacterium]